MRFAAAGGAGLSRFEWLVGAEAFWRRARDDIAAAGRRVLVQAMTFEGDAVGLAAAEAIGAARAADRRVLVDDYTRLVVSDRWVLSPAARLDPAHRAEVRETARMFGRLAGQGVGLRVTNPVGPWLTRYPARNHKKVIIADDVAYVGGVNFSDHNFAWHDFMLRIEGCAEADFLAEDFTATYAGRPRAMRREFPGLVIASLDGRANAAGFAELMSLIDASKGEIVAISPYLTFPFTGRLAMASARGVRVRLITPLANNKPLVRLTMVARAQAAGFEISHWPRMSHAKGLLIDGESLAVGSANFDFVSYSAEEELLAIVSAPEAVAEFRTRIVDPALAMADGEEGGRVPAALGYAAEGLLRLASLAARAARTSRRGVMEWPSSA